jgi:hypothetical protein
MTRTISPRLATAALLAACAGLGLARSAPPARAQRVVHGTTHTAVNNGANVPQNLNANRDIDVDVDRDYHPITTPVMVETASVSTAVAIGTVVHSLPPACSAVEVGNIAYQQCGSTWYQPQYAGTQLTYVVVAPPR